MHDAVARALLQAGYDPESEEDMRLYAEDLRKMRDHITKIENQVEQRKKRLNVILGALVPIAAWTIWQWVVGKIHLVFGAPPPIK